METFCCCSSFTLAYTLGWMGVVGSIINLLGIILSIISEQNSFHNKTTVTLFTITICLCNLLISLLLIIGTAKRRRSFLLPWLICQGIQVVLTFICIIVAAFAIVFLIIDGKFDLGTSFLAIVFWIIAIGLSVIGLRIWQVIYSLYRHLGENENGAIIQQNIENIESQAVEHASCTNHVDVSYRKL